MGFFEILNTFKNKGQSAVEYILLMAVIVTLVYTVLNNPMFKQVMGPESVMFKKFRLTMEYSYSYGNWGQGVVNTQYLSGGIHPLYSPLDATGAESRFFGPKESYP